MGSGSASGAVGVFYMDGREVWVLRCGLCTFNFLGLMGAWCSSGDIGGAGVVCL